MDISFAFALGWACVHLFALIYEVTQNNFIITHLLAIISFIEQTFAAPRLAHRINSEGGPRHNGIKQQIVSGLVTEKYVNERGRRAGK